MKIRSRIFGLFLLFVLLAFPEMQSAAGGADRGASGAEVTIDNFTFSPQILTVRLGTRITWTNHDDIPHAVMSENAEFHSKTLDTDDTFSFTPTQPGTYLYFCSLHPKMTAKLVVQ